jgi:hypothetical protein
VWRVSVQILLRSRVECGFSDIPFELITKHFVNRPTFFAVE